MFPGMEPSGHVDFSDESHCLAYLLRGSAVDDDDLYVMINSHWEERRFVLPVSQPTGWKVAIDTGRNYPEDIFEAGSEPLVNSESYLVHERSVVVLLNRRSKDE